MGIWWVGMGSPSGPRSFDPFRIADLEYRMWVAYYLRRWNQVLAASVRLLLLGFGADWVQALRGARLMMRAVRLWAPFPDNDPDGAQARMRELYALIRLRFGAARGPGPGGQPGDRLVAGAPEAPVCGRSRGNGRRTGRVRDPPVLLPVRPARGRGQAGRRAPGTGHGPVRSVGPGGLPAGQPAAPAGAGRAGPRLLRAARGRPPRESQLSRDHPAVGRSLETGHSATALPVAPSTVSAAASRSSSAGWAREYTEARPRGRTVTRPQSRRQARCPETVDWASPSVRVRSTTRAGPRASCWQIASRAGSARDRNRVAAGRSSPEVSSGYHRHMPMISGIGNENDNDRSPGARGTGRGHPDRRDDTISATARDAASMHEGHPHGGKGGHAHIPGAGADRRYLLIALLLLAAFMLAEVIVAVAVRVAGPAVRRRAHAVRRRRDRRRAVGDPAGRPAGPGAWTFGWKRAEILSAAGNGITLLVVAAIVTAEAISRLIHPPRVEGLPSSWSPPSASPSISPPPGCWPGPTGPA